MTERVNGKVQTGVWFSRDVRFVNVDVTGATFLTDRDLVTPIDPSSEEINTSLEAVIKILETRGTVTGISLESETVMNVIVEYAQAFDDAAVVTELQDSIDLIVDSTTGFGYDLSAAALTVESGFVAAAEA